MLFDFQEKPVERRSIRLIVWAVAIITFGLTYCVTSPAVLVSPNNEVTSRCKIPEYAILESYRRDNTTLQKILFGDEFRNKSAAKLTGAVQIKTDIGDDAPQLEEDPQFWEKKFRPFHEYLENTFPSVWSFSKIEKINHWGLLVTWEGSDSSLEPVLLSAHQDVVPIAESTLDQWEHPPFDGVYDGHQLWGRGSADCKNLLIGLLETLEELHLSKFQPRRSIILAFGFDEEIGGERGANHISQFLLERYGENSIYAVIDEGGQSLVKHGDVALALIGASEKGLINVKVGITAPGGHSSVPPDHTSIGILSELITRLEKNPFAPIFSPRNPTFYEYQCIAEFSDELPLSIRKEVEKAETSTSAREKIAEYIYHSNLGSRYLVTTSQAIDIIHGGVKSNALPEYAEVIINHRIAVESSVKEVVSHDFQYIEDVAKDFGIGLVVNGSVHIPKTEKGYFSVSTSWELQPAPFTPINDERWNLFAGTLRHVYEKICRGTLEEFEGLPVITSPGMATGNTDTQYYWDLTKHIYRYRPGLTPSVQAHAHGANEHIPFNSHLQIIAFYYEYLQVIDSA